ncbi:uncharacterized protein LOC117338118 isoform X1 [Pecten maximus]|uniref:uncharacterized protein LOC117338118 isoform X1 n=1 Tax=Pecten maximus TaxID=6579 RepID=UPI001458AE2D|nr:uncharacterized protein LOC117338118 isoform X1 [Pecten maximus]
MFLFDFVYFIFYLKYCFTEFLSRAVTELSKEYGESLIIRPIFADHEQGMEQLEKVKGTKLILWFTGLLNLSYDDQVHTLRKLSTMMTDKCRLVFNADITLDKNVLLKAYNDQSGLSRKFMQNGLLRLNKEQGSHIDLTNFTFEVDFISDTNPHYMSYVRTYITAKEDIRYPIPGLGIDLVMGKGERLYLHEGEGYSCKYTL